MKTASGVKGKDSFCMVLEFLPVPPRVIRDVCSMLSPEGGVFFGAELCPTGTKSVLLRYTRNLSLSQACELIWKALSRKGMEASSNANNLRVISKYSRALGVL